MVLTAPRPSGLRPSFRESLGDAVLVAHNALFDVGFLRAAAARLDLIWPRPPVVDTLALARRVVTRDEAPNHKLGTLAALFRTEVRPDHRALTDARATVDVLHGLFARMSSLGLTHVEDLATAADPVPPARRRKATRQTTCPPAPVCTCSWDRARRCSTWAPPRTCAAGYGPTSPLRRSGDGSARWWTWPPQCARSRAPPRWRRPCGSCAPSPSTTPATTAAPAPRSGARGCGSPP